MEEVPWWKKVLKCIFFVFLCIDFLIRCFLFFVFKIFGAVSKP